MAQHEELSGKRIFVVEDQATNTAIMKTLLELHGAVVGFERWGRDAAKRLAAFAPVDLILLDLMFPDGVTGYDLFDVIRGTEGLDSVPIVAVSASDPGEAIPRTLKQGFAGFIAKPISFSEFPAQIVSVLNGEKVWVYGRTFAR